ncbi:FeoA family protein [Neobittarella massiliensis]
MIAVANTPFGESGKETVMMPLTFAEVGKQTTIKQIRGRDDTQKFLGNLGFVVGGAVTVVAETGGNVIVNVKDTRLAISKAMAGRIIV